MLQSGRAKMITNMISAYAAKLSDSEYLKLRAEVIQVIKKEDEERGFK